MDWKSLLVNLGFGFLDRFLINRVANQSMDKFGKELEKWPRERLEQWLVRFGKAFGPPGLMHFSELPFTEQEKLLRRVPVLRKKHDDWPKAFRFIDRTLTTWIGPAPEMVDMIEGNATSMKPIPNHGEWFVIRGGMASTTEDGVHNRIGWRYDDVDRYWTLSFKVAFFE